MRVWIGIATAVGVGMWWPYTMEYGGRAPGTISGQARAIASMWSHKIIHHDNATMSKPTPRELQSLMRSLHRERRRVEARLYLVQDLIIVVQEEMGLGGHMLPQVPDVKEPPR